MDYPNEIYELCANYIRDNVRRQQIEDYIRKYVRTYYS